MAMFSLYVLCSTSTTAHLNKCWFTLQDPRNQDLLYPCELNARREDKLNHFMVEFQAMIQPAI